MCIYIYIHVQLNTRRCVGITWKKRQLTGLYF